MMLFQFLNVLIQVLLQKSHDLLQEEIAISIYNMASVDFDNFYTNFLPHFLSSCEGLAANQRSVLGQNFKLDKVGFLFFFFFFFFKGVSSWCNG